ncbi:uracil-DNA glycosylase [Lysinibacillus sp. 2017]|uniref:uracil-DNA glycosylase n=1 Tax=unclassified Lysinibacillus TaxID=2636778 RepID=UPI000D5264E9|nr:MULTISPECIES: uracil-DNA glycosylase [unclassified Lysinibacillus]AWE06244.1 uracil-DNA glycosylase [Lysinibacillus sp. 2017]TGN35280.1 uracil-DNA glycosylase [Lysinibacillus sp. S2017]
MIETVTNKWRDVLHEQTTYDYYKKLQTFLAKEYNEATIYPKQEAVLNALTYTDYDDVKVVLLGQDPYHGPRQAHGLSFSVLPGQKLPPSLRNMMKELQDDLGCELPDHGELTHWAKQGVLLLNTVLTVRAGEAHSHKGQGWEQFTDAVIESIAKREQPVVFLLWGKPAQSKRQIIERYPNGHIILEAPHPSPLSAHRGFFGSNPYSKTNDALIQLGQAPIDWCIPHKQAKLFDESMVK